MAENQIAKLSPRHETIITFLIANPQMKRGDIARHFGVTQSWLSVIINSDAFVAKLNKRQDEFHSEATTSIKEKLNTLAHMSLDRMINAVETVPDIDQVRQIGTAALDRLGYSKPNGGSLSRGPALIQQNNFLTVDAGDLAAARNRIIEKGVTIDQPRITDQADSRTAEEL